MFTKREKNLSFIMIFIQVILTLSIFSITQLFFPHQIFNQNVNFLFLFQISLIWTFFLNKFKLGIVFRARSFGSRFRWYLVTVCFGCSLLVFETKFLPFIVENSFTISYILYFALSDFIVLILFKLAFYYVMRLIRRKGKNTRQIIIIADQTSVQFIEFFLEANDWGYQIKSIITSNKDFLGKFEKTVYVENDEALKAYITKNTIDDIFYCVPIEEKQYDLEKLIKDSEEIGVNLHIMQSEYLKRVASSTKLKKGYKFITYSKAPHSYFFLKIKDVFDLIFSIIILISLTPFLLIIALLIKLEDNGPVLYKQERIGLNGRRFVFFKFRSMIVNAEAIQEQLMDKNEVDGPVFKIENDPRITKIGKFLRKTSLDELPQFYNVLKGDMSVVGPRPPLLREVQQYDRSQLRRLSMKPGITCIWQVAGRNTVSFEEWMRMDLVYIDNWSLWLDFKIALATVVVIFKANGQ
ncbi:MAG: sugar transferase [Paludibacter sp.]|nr:sugar transferase [Paludibacter sp.]